jgi:hypothetical protein
MDLSGLSIIELKQLLARVNHDLKMGKPTIKRIKKEAAPVLSEAAICNQYAIKYSGNKALPIIHNAKLKADIAIQQDILDYLNNGGTIKTTQRRKRIKPLTITNSIISL